MDQAHRDAKRSDWAKERSRHGGVDEIPLPPRIPGRLFLCGKHFIGPDPEAAMTHVAADAVICLNERSELDRYPNYVDWILNQPPGRVVWWPVADLGAPEPEVALATLDQLRSRLANGERLLVHCGGGIGRAGTLAAGILVAFGYEPGAAVHHVRAHRPMAGPEAGPQDDLLRWLHERISGRDGQDPTPALGENG